MNQGLQANKIQDPQPRESNQLDSKRGMCFDVFIMTGVGKFTGFLKLFWYE